MRTLITTAALIASLALAGTSAIAATANVHKATKTPVAHAHAAVHAPKHYAARHVAPRHYAARYYAPRYFAPGPYGFNAGQFIQSMLGGAWPPLNVRLAHHKGSTPGYESPSYTPSYDSPPIDTSSDAYTAAAQAQQMNDTNAMLQSMQAAQAQNDQANADFNAGIAAALQTEINANN